MRIQVDTFPALTDPSGSSHLMWETTSRNQVYTCPIFGLNSVHRTNHDGREGDFVEIESTPWVTVIPWFLGTDGKAYFVMERQYRHGSDSITLEFPAGLVEKDESHEHAGFRELLEETGLKANSMKLLGSVSPNSAFMNNRSNFFLAEQLDVTSSRHLDLNEEIDVFNVPVNQVLEQAGCGELDNGIMLMAVFLFLREAQNRPELLGEKN